jgi:hypothetical protein
MVASLLLGPGTRVTYAAIALLANSGTVRADKSPDHKGSSPPARGSFVGHAGNERGRHRRPRPRGFFPVRSHSRCRCRRRPRPRGGLPWANRDKYRGARRPRPRGVFRPPCSPQRARTRSSRSRGVLPTTWLAQLVAKMSSRPRGGPPEHLVIEFLIAEKLAKPRDGLSEGAQHEPRAPPDEPAWPGSVTDLDADAESKQALCAWPASSKQRRRCPP